MLAAPSRYSRSLCQNPGHPSNSSITLIYTYGYMGGNSKLQVLSFVKGGPKVSTAKGKTCIAKVQRFGTRKSCKDNDAKGKLRAGKGQKAGERNVSTHFYFDQHHVHSYEVTHRSLKMKSVCMSARFRLHGFTGAHLRRCVSV